MDFLLRVLGSHGRILSKEETESLCTLERSLRLPSEGRWKRVGLEPRAQGGGGVGSWVGEMGSGQASAGDKGRRHRFKRQMYRESSHFFTLLLPSSDNPGSSSEFHNVKILLDTR